ncbi:hypothetical protein [Halomicrobium salinisoli]|uniref:hypothetical protein n=1 Tax=Halomicrobium salinisoli TaxID=2878391 RepID=UPI001CEFB244|nr:hypothetical protein [Halomicrobium salinisoli]
MSVDTSDLVVTLTEDNDVSQLTLAGPDGELVAEQSVSPGVTTIRLPILDMEAGVSGYEHYTPGVQTLTVSYGEETAQMDVPLEPGLQVTDVQQYRGEESPTALGNIVVSIENTGTGPTWIYDIIYSNAPYSAANKELSEGAGIPLLQQPDSPTSAIITPEQEQQYRGSTPPLLFPEDEFDSCKRQTVSFQIQIGIATGDHITRALKAELGGDKKLDSGIGHVTCSSSDIRLVEEEV